MRLPYHLQGALPYFVSWGKSGLSRLPFLTAQLTFADGPPTEGRTSGMVNHDRVAPEASPAMFAVPPEAEVNSEH
jgi:hypothetical protein